MGSRPDWPMNNEQKTKSLFWTDPACDSMLCLQCMASPLTRMLSYFQFRKSAIMDITVAPETLIYVYCRRRLENVVLRLGNRMQSFF